MIATEQFYSFRVGMFHCVSVSDGYYVYTLPLMFGRAPADDVKAALRSHGWPDDRVVSPYACLFVDTGRHRVLIDVGAGPLAPSTGTLEANLRAASIEPESIDTIIITHLHPDHIGGNLGPNHVTRYPNATFFIPEKEWTFWWSPDADQQCRLPEHMLSLIREQSRPLEHEAEFVIGSEEIVPGIQLIPAEGHTPGQVAVAISSEGSDLLHIADTACHPLHLEFPEWSLGTDVDRAAALVAKRRIFDRAARDAALVFTHHFAPSPNLGRVIKRGEGWEWIPELPMER